MDQVTRNPRGIPVQPVSSDVAGNFPAVAELKTNETFHNLGDGTHGAKNTAGLAAPLNEKFNAGFADFYQAERDAGRDVYVTSLGVNYKTATQPEKDLASGGTDPVNYANFPGAGATAADADTFDWITQKTPIYESVAALVADDPRTINCLFLALGREVSGDGGEGFIQWKPAQDKAEADAGYIVDPDVAITIADQGTGTGTGCYVRETDVIKPEFWEVDPLDAVPALQQAMLVSYNHIIPVKGGSYTLNQPFDIMSNQAGPFWSGVTESKPVNAKFNRLVITHDDYAIISQGRIISGLIEIDHMIGAGIRDDGAGSIDFGVVRGGAERAAIYCNNGGHRFSIGTLEDFNIGILFEGAFTAHVTVGHHIAVGAHVITRTDAGGAKNQALFYEQLSGGGVFSNITIPNDALRRSQGSKYGCVLDDVTGSDFIMRVTQYVNYDDDSIAIKIGESAETNTIEVYLEGTRGLGYFIFCEGNDNHIRNRGGMGSPSTASGTGGVFLGGTGNRLTGLQRASDTASLPLRTTSTGTSPYIIEHGNYVDGGVVFSTVNDATPSESVALLDSNTSYSFQFSAATVTRTFPNTHPQWRGSARTVRWLITDDTQATMTSPVIDITSETSDKVAIEFVARNEETDKRAQVAAFLEDQSGNVIGVGNTISLPLTGEWTLCRFVEKIPAGVTGIRLLVRIRNGEGLDDSGMRAVLAYPYMSFDLRKEEDQAALDIGADSELIINAGEALISHTHQAPLIARRVDTEASAASDDLDLIEGGRAGQMLTLRSSDNTRAVTVKHSTDIRLDGNADVVLDSIYDRLTLQCVAPDEWVMLSLSKSN